MSPLVDQECALKFNYCCAVIAQQIHLIRSSLCRCQHQKIFDWLRSSACTSLDHLDRWMTVTTLVYRQLLVLIRDCFFFSFSPNWRYLQASFSAKFSPKSKVFPWWSTRCGCSSCCRLRCQQTSQSPCSLIKVYLKIFNFWKTKTFSFFICPNWSSKV